MKVTGVCFSRNGVELFEKIQKAFEEHGEYEDFSATWYFKGSFKPGRSGVKVKNMQESLSEWTAKRFLDTDVLIYIGAVGIAVRAIAPYVRDKRHDPAILTVDDRGTFVIPILSGHVGGANEIASMLADELRSTPVITTATDLYDKFAVDVYAKKNDLVISNMTYAKEVSAAVIANEPVGFYTHFPVKGKLPEGLVWSEKLDAAMVGAGERSDGVSLGIYISPSYNRAYFDHTLWLIPKCLTIGIGCKKGTEEYKIENLIKETLNSLCLYEEAIRSVATIDRKKEEPGLVSFCQHRDLKLDAYSAEELSAVPGSFSGSDFVEETVGVDNVCERAALKEAGEGGKLLTNKISRDGVTCAVAMIDWRVVF